MYKPGIQSTFFFIYLIFFKETLGQPGHYVAAVELLHQETQDGRLGVRRERVKGLGPHGVAHLRVKAVRLQEDAKRLRNRAARQLQLGQLVPEDLHRLRPRQRR